MREKTLKRSFILTTILAFNGDSTEGQFLELWYGGLCTTYRCAKLTEIQLNKCAHTKTLGTHTPLHVCTRIWHTPGPWYHPIEMAFASKFFFVQVSFGKGVHGWDSGTRDLWFVSVRDRMCLSVCIRVYASEGLLRLSIRGLLQVEEAMHLDDRFSFQQKAA